MVLVELHQNQQKVVCPRGRLFEGKYPEGLYRLLKCQHNQSAHLIEQDGQDSERLTGRSASNDAEKADLGGLDCLSGRRERINRFSRLFRFFRL